MIVVLKRGAEQDKREQLINWLKNQGLGVHISEGEYQTVLGLIGDTARVDMDLIESLSIVDSVKRVTEPFKCCNRKFHPDDMIVQVGDVKVGGGNFCMIAGPCSVESEEQIVAVAKAVKASGANMLRGGAFKPRTSPYDFQGLKAEGIELLKIARQETGLPIVTEIMGTNYLPLFEDVDVIQVGARNMQNFDLLKAVGRQEKPVMIKRGMSATYEEWLMSAEYVMAGGNENVILCERGVRTFETYTRNTLDLAAIPVLRKLKFGQTILDIGPKWHKKKQGTPTMGGLMFIIGIFCSAAVVLVCYSMTVSRAGLDSSEKTKLWAGLIMALMFGAVGFADDYIKVVKKRNLGLSIIQKTVFQLIICAAYLTSLYLAMDKDPYMFIPFVGNVSLGIWFWILGVCVLYGAINAVNFTDGIDGLCSSVTATAAISFVIMAVVHKAFGIGIVSAALLGGCIGFFVWNRYPAKVFMGDTGSMFLGGLVVAIAYAFDCPIILILTGIIYFIEGLSDVIQIGYFKITHGKRIFRMAPIHHHFEMGGWSEKKIDTVFCTFNLVGGIIGVLLMYYGGFSR